MALLLLAFSGCSSSPPKSIICSVDRDCDAGEICNPSRYCQAAPGCLSGAPCPAGQTCNLSTGVCQCSGDAGCPIGQICNAALECVSPPTCNFDADCPDTEYCDTKSHGCIPNGTCTQNIHCPAGQICKNDGCVAGCLTDGDCPLVNFNSSPPQLTPYACVNGQCVQNACTTEADCPAFSDCGSDNQCQTVCGNTPFCMECDPNAESPCGDQANLCLIDPGDPADCGDECLSFCGLDCSTGQSCPQGAPCGPITEINEGTGGPAQACQAGSLCPTPTGEIRCPAEEGAASGACPCFSDDDCPTDQFGDPISCDLDSGSCLVGYQCTPAPQYTCQTYGCGNG